MQSVGYAESPPGMGVIMSQQTCCPMMDTQWTQRVVEGQYADIYFCANCGHVHRTEKYAVPMLSLIHI